MRHLFLLVEDHAIVTARPTVIFVFLLELFIGRDNALGDLLELTFALLGLDVVGVELLYLLQIGSVEVFVSKEIFTLLSDAQDITILLICQFLDEFLLGTDVGPQSEAQPGAGDCQSDRPHHQKYSTIKIYTGHLGSSITLIATLNITKQQLFTV